MEIVFATGNPHKLDELKKITRDNSIEFILPSSDFNPVENGSTFEENSYIKAKEANRTTGKISLADDSGLCVEALNGAPGLYSARYAGTQKEKIDKILNELKPHTNRKAKFICVMTLLDSEGNVLHVSKGECHGEIAKEQSGTNGFGFDPVFIVDGYNKTMADLPEEIKNSISHRANAMNDMLDYINKSNILI